MMGGDMRTAISCFIVAWFVAGCFPGNLAKDYKLESPDQAVLVLGVEPPTFRVSIFPVQVKNGRVRESQSAVLVGAGENGFLAGSVTGDRTLAILRMYDTTIKPLTPMFAPCDGVNAMTFEVPAGKVVYLGHLAFRHTGDGKVAFSHRKDFQSARRFVDENYPNLKGKLEEGTFRLMPSDVSCRW